MFCCPVYDAIKDLLFRKMSSIYDDLVRLDDYEKIDLCFRKRTFFVADFICQVHNSAEYLWGFKCWSGKTPFVMDQINQLNKHQISSNEQNCWVKVEIKFGAMQFQFTKLVFIKLCLNVKALSLTYIQITCWYD